MALWICTADILFFVSWDLVFDVGATGIYVIHVIWHKLIIILVGELSKDFDMVLANVMPATLEGTTDIVAES